MLDPGTRERIEQERFNCLTAKVLHIDALRKLNHKILAVDALAVIVPVLYFPVRYLGKDSWNAAAYFEGIWEFLAASLLAATIFKFVAKWQDRLNNHGKLLGENIALVNQAADLLNDVGTTSASSKSFLALAERCTQADSELLGQPKPSKKQAAYREAMKEVGGPSVICPVCHSSPWKFREGSCQACGNTPTN